MRSMLLLGLLAFAGSAIAQYPGAEPAPKPWLSGFRSIQPGQAREWVYKLAGPEFMGRNPATPHYEASAKWVAEKLASFGLKPAGDRGTYFQRFTIARRKVDSGSASLRLTEGGLELEYDKDFRIIARSDVLWKTKIAFLNAPDGAELSASHLASLSGRLILPSKGLSPSLRRQLIEAISSGKINGSVVAAITSAFPNARPGPFVVQELQTRLDPSRPEGLALTQDAADRLAQACSATGFLTEDTPSTVVIKDSDTVFELQAKVVFERQFETVNVIAKIDGSDKTLKAESVVIGSHLDHLGGEPPDTHFGADDNASGCVASLLIARAVALNPTKPKRTIVFGFWSSEEIGLHGSRFFAARPSVPMEQTVAYLNMDMVGRDANYAPLGDLADDNRDSIYCGSAKLNSPDLYSLLHRVNRHVGLNLRDDKEDRSMRSDTGNFIAAGVPTLKAWTGEHEDYHKASDTPDKVNYIKLTNVAKWLYLATCELAASPSRPSFRKDGRYLSGRLTFEGEVGLSQAARIEVRLVKLSSSGERATIDRTVSRRPGQLPFRFCLRFGADELDSKAAYVVEAEVFDGGRRLMRSIRQVPVLTQGGPSANVTVPLELVSVQDSGRMLHSTFSVRPAMVTSIR